MHIPAARFAFFCVLLSIVAAPVHADEQPVLAAIRWTITTGVSGSFDSAAEAFAAYQSWHATQGLNWHVDDLRVCTAQDQNQPGFSYKTNGVDSYYCGTWYYNNGSGSGLWGQIVAAPTCPAEKPVSHGKSRLPSPPANVVDILIYCTGPTGGLRPEPPPPELCPSPCGNPILAESKTKVERSVDIAIDSVLRFERTYSSNTGEWRHTFSDRAGNVSLNTLPAGPLQSCFMGTLGMAGGVLRRHCSPYVSNEELGRTNAGDWLVHRADGRTVTFSSSTGRSNSLGTREQARQTLDGLGQYAGLVIHREDGRVEEFDVAGRLIKRSALDGSGVLLTYLGPSGEKIPSSAPSCAGLSIGPLEAGKPSCVTDRISGRQLLFHYNTEGTLLSVTDPASASVSYEYGGPTAAGSMQGFHALTSVNFPDSAERVYHYNESGRTSGANLPWALTGITDERNVRYASFGYAANGRAVSTARAQGTLSFTISGDVVTDALGTQRTYSSSLLTSHASDGSVASAVYAPTRKIIPSSGGGTATRQVAYDAVANISSITDFKGSVTTFVYDPARRLQVQRVEASGTARARTISTAWHPDWSLQAQVSEPKRMTWWIYNGQPDPTDANAIVSCAPPAALLDGKPIAVLCRRIEQTTTDPNGAAGLSATLAGPPRTWAYSYNIDGQLLTINGPRADVADVVTYSYYVADDTSTPKAYRRGDLHTITNAAGHTTTISAYNAFGQPLTVVDANGTATAFAYDARGRMTSRTVGTESTTLEYWPTGLLKKVTAADASSLLYTYDDAHRLTRLEDGAGNRIEYTLDGMGNRTAESIYDSSSALRQTRTQIFNTLSQLSQQVGAAGTAAVTTTYSYDNNGNQTTIAAPLVRTTGQLYDELNRLAQVTDSEGGITRFTYDANDNLTAVEDPRGLDTTYAYDGFRELTSLVSPDTGTTTNTYDAAGNLSSSTDARGKTATYGYDALNRVTQIAYADRTVGFSYDTGTNGTGNLTGASDGNHSLAWTYDVHGRVIGKGQTVGAITKSIGYGYTDGKLTSVVTPSGQTVAYGYSDGEIASVTLNGTTTILSQALHEPFGPTSGWTWGNGTLAARVYDADGRVAQLDSAGLKTYAYDDASRITGITDSDNPVLNASYSYDRLDRVLTGVGPPPTLSLSATSAVGGDPLAVTVNNVETGGYWLAVTRADAPNTTYNSWAEVTPSSGSFVWNTSVPALAGTYEVRLFRGEFAEILTSAEIAVSAPTPPAQATLRANSGTVGPGTTVTVRLTNGPGGAQDWLALAAVGASTTTYLQWTYVGGGTGRDWTITMPSTEGQYEFRLFLNNGYTLAATSGPIHVTDDSPVSSVGGIPYDANGNRLDYGQSSYTISSSSNRVLSVSGALTRTYSYDNAGNVTSDGTVAFTYSDAGRMTSATKSGLTTSYATNALDQRVEKTTGGNSIYFVYDEAGHLIGEYSNAGDLIQETVWLGDIPVATLRSNGTGGVNMFHVHTDHLNTPRRISRPSDNVVVWRWDSDSFGTTAASEDPDADSNLFVYNLRFPGQYFDAETSLHYNYYRDYDSQTGRYVQSDPIGLLGGTNTFGYANGDPLSSLDPLGLRTIYKWPRNNYGDVPPPGVSCEEAIFSGGILMGWKPCESGKGCSGDQPMPGPYDYGYDGWPSFDSRPGGSGGDGYPSRDREYWNAASAWAGTHSYFVGLFGCVYSGSAGSGGLSGYAGCGVGVGQSSIRASWQNSLNFGDPTGWGARGNISGSFFGGAGSASVFVNTSGVNFTIGVGPGNGGTGNVTYGYRESRRRDD